MKFNISTASSLQDALKILLTGLTKISFTDNFESFEVQDIEIASGDIASVRNQLTFIPSKYIIVKQKGNGVVTMSDKTWTLSSLYLINNGPNDVIVSVIFMR